MVRVTSEFVLHISSLIVRCRDGRVNHTIPTVRGLGDKDRVDEAIKPIVLGLEELLAGDVSIGSVTIGYPHRCRLISCLASLSLDDSTTLWIYRSGGLDIISVQSQRLEFSCDTSKVVSD